MRDSNSKSAARDIVWGGLTVVLIIVAVTLIVLFSAPSSDGFAQQAGDLPGDKTIDAEIRAEIIDSVTAVLNEYYVFPEVAKEMEEHVRKQMKEGKYDTLNKLSTFTDVLTADMQEICRDLHFHVSFAPDEYFERMEGDTMTAEALEEYVRGMAYNNYGFYKLERLNGNIGYLDLRGFNDARWAGETAVAAMNFLANSNAIIIDLRQNGGGNPSMIQLISSYFFDEPVHLNSFYIRSEDTIQQFWTAAHVEGKRMSDVDLYVLTSQRTFSGAEEFTYNMKNMERATIIGETTGGGAHPVEDHRFPHLNVVARVPFGRAINPITGTNWEGTGVTPHIEVPQEDALLVAQKEALTKVIDKTTDEDLKEALEWDMETLNIEINPIEVDQSVLKKYVGVYGPRTLTFEEGQLYYQREGRPKFKAIPFTEDTFWFKEVDYFRLKVVMDENGNPTELHGLYQGGHVDVSMKTDG